MTSYDILTLWCGRVPVVPVVLAPVRHCLAPPPHAALVRLPGHLPAAQPLRHRQRLRIHSVYETYKEVSQFCWRIPTCSYMYWLSTFPSIPLCGVSWIFNIDGWCSHCILNSEAMYWQQSHSGVTTTMTRTTSAALWATGILCRQRSWPLSASTLAPTSRCTETATSPSRASPPVSQTGARAAVVVDRYSVQSYISLSAHRYNVYSISLLFFYIMEIYKQLSNNQIFIDI